MLDDPALVLVDCQRQFCDPACNDKLASDEDAAAAVRLAVRYADDFLIRYRSSGRTPIVVRTLHEEGVLSNEASSRGPGPCRPGTEEARFVEGFDVESSDVVVTKRRYNSFFGTDLEVYLNANDISSLLLGGVNTHICVLATTIGAVDRDYDVTVLSDCVAASSLGSHRAGLDLLSTLADDIRASDDVAL